MVPIEGEIVIRRPVEEVFDFVADERHEPSFNPGLRGVELLTPEPIGRGSRFRGHARTAGRQRLLSVEYTGFERPHLLASRSRMGRVEVEGDLRFESVPEGTLLRWHWTLAVPPALAPVAGTVGRRRERAIWGALKCLLEDGDGPPQRGAAVRDFAACARQWARLTRAGRLASPADHVGLKLRFEDGSSSFVFRETRVRDVTPAEPVVLVIAFRLAALGSSRTLHAAFRRECVLHTPLFAGFPGFRSKLWADDVDTGVYRGVYEWDGVDAARAYARRMVALLAPFSTHGTARYHVVDGLRRDEFLRDPALAPPDAGGAWWRLASAAG